MGLNERSERVRSENVRRRCHRHRWEHKSKRHRLAKDPPDRNKGFSLPRLRARTRPRKNKTETLRGMMNLRGYLENDWVTVDLPLTFSITIFPVSISSSFTALTSQTKGERSRDTTCQVGIEAFDVFLCLINNGPGLAFSFGIIVPLVIISVKKIRPDLNRNFWVFSNRFICFG